MGERPGPSETKAQGKAQGKAKSKSKSKAKGKAKAKAKGKAKAKTKAKAKANGTATSDATPSSSTEPDANPNAIPDANPDANEDASSAETHKPEHIPFDWHRYGLIFEFKKKGGDPFRTVAAAQAEHGVEKPEPEFCQTRGQLAQYAAELFNHQHRTHAFQLLIAENDTRFLLWDRSGTLVTDSFDLSSAEGSQLLTEFLWNYDHMTPAERGWDESVTQPAAREARKFTEEVSAFIKAMNTPGSGQRCVEGAEDTLNDAWPTYKVTVDAGQSGETQTVIVQKPFEVSRSPLGRATRAYLAYSLTLKRLVFLKDGWRVEFLGLANEDAMYARLRDADVPFIPSVLCAGDVFVNGVVQTTRVHEVAQGSLDWKIQCSASRKHYHHRVIQELAYPLFTAKNTQEYTRAFRDVLTGAFRPLVQTSAGC